MADDTVITPPADVWNPETSIWDEPLPALDDLDLPAEPAPLPPPVEVPDALVLDYRVEYPLPDGGARVFEIEEPDVKTLLALIKIFSNLGLRAQARAGSQLRGLFMSVVREMGESANGKTRTKQSEESIIPIESIFLAIGDVLDERDIVKIGCVVLFGGDEQVVRDAEKWFKALGPRGLKLDPILRGLAYRIARSEDLARAMGNSRLFQAAISVWNGMNRGTSPTA
jgi:hypothetical protein